MTPEHNHTLPGRPRPDHASGRGRGAYPRVQHRPGRGHPAEPHVRASPSRGHPPRASPTTAFPSIPRTPIDRLRCVASTPPPYPPITSGTTETGAIALHLQHTLLTGRRRGQDDQVTLWKSSQFIMAAVAMMNQLDIMFPTSGPRRAPMPEWKSSVRTARPFRHSSPPLLPPPRWRPTSRREVGHRGSGEHHRTRTSPATGRRTSSEFIATQLEDVLPDPPRAG